MECTQLCLGSFGGMEGGSSFRILSSKASLDFCKPWHSLHIHWYLPLVWGYCCFGNVSSHLQDGPAIKCCCVECFCSGDSLLPSFLSTPHTFSSPCILNQSLIGLFWRGSVRIFSKVFILYFCKSWASQAPVCVLPFFFLLRKDRHLKKWVYESSISILNVVLG